MHQATMLHEHAEQSEGQSEGMSLDILNNLLKRRGVTPSDLARETGIHKSTISLIMSGKQNTTSAVNVARIARVLNVSPDYLLGFSKTPEPTPLMLGELLTQLTLVARQLPTRRQRDLLAIAQTYLDTNLDAQQRRALLIHDIIELIEEYDGQLSREQLLSFLSDATSACALPGENGKQPTQSNH